MYLWRESCESFGQSCKLQNRMVWPDAVHEGSSESLRASSWPLEDETLVFWNIQQPLAGYLELLCPCLMHEIPFA